MRLRAARLLRYVAAWLSPCENHVPFPHHLPKTCQFCWTRLD